jgi:hypothetical protein
MPYKDPEVRRQKHKEYAKKHYEENKVSIIKKAHVQKKITTAKFAEFKATNSCVTCGENHPATLDFHHVEKSHKNKKLHNLVKDGHTWKRIMEEVDKCVVLCANCHRIHHHEERLIKKQKKLAKKQKSSNIR